MNQASWPHPMPVLLAVARAFGCPVADIERWIESELGSPVPRKDSPEDRLLAIRRALQVGEAESIIDAADQAARLTRRVS